MKGPLERPKGSVSSTGGLANQGPQKNKMLSVTVISYNPQLSNIYFSKSIQDHLSIKSTMVQCCVKQKDENMDTYKLERDLKTYTHI